jgi:hypothetical protein
VNEPSNTTTNVDDSMVIPRCQHIKFDGVQCGSPALRNKKHCFYHNRVRTLRRGDVIVPLLENAKAINYTAMQTAEALLTGYIDRRDAAQILFALKIASLNLRYLKTDPPASEIALEDPAETHYQAGMDKAHADATEHGTDITQTVQQLMDDRVRGLTP